MDEELTGSGTLALNLDLIASAGSGTATTSEAPINSAPFYFCFACQRKQAES